MITFNITTLAYGSQLPGKSFIPSVDLGDLAQKPNSTEKCDLHYIYYSEKWPLLRIVFWVF